MFDAFGTVVHIDWSKLPSHSADGQTVHTTIREVHAAYTRHFGSIDLALFYQAFVDSFEEVANTRRSELREIPSQERFRTMLQLLGHDAANTESLVLEELTLAHMNQLQTVFEVRPETARVLEWAASRFRMAMISNFDYAPALYATLDRYAIRAMFENVIVSVEVGWRKPHPIIFKRAFDELQIQPAEALFIGDQLHLDVLGAKQAGMDVVWIDTGREQWTSDYPEPTFRVQSIGEVVALLEGR